MKSFLSRNIHVDFSGIFQKLQCKNLNFLLQNSSARGIIQTNTRTQMCPNKSRCNLYLILNALYLLSISTSLRWLQITRVLHWKLLEQKVKCLQVLTLVYQCKWNLMYNFPISDCNFHCAKWEFLMGEWDASIMCLLTSLQQAGNYNTLGKRDILWQEPPERSDIYSFCEN